MSTDPGSKPELQVRYGSSNPHPLSQMRTQLVWNGKYDEYGNRREVDVARCAMPLQKIETIDEPKSRAEADNDQATLFELQRQAEKLGHFRNLLIWGDNMLVSASLMKDFKGKIDLIYIDPPFNADADFSMEVPIGDQGETITKDQSTLEFVAYSDMWGKGTDSYLHMMSERLLLMRELLAETGSIYVHCDWHVSHLMRSLLDDVFSPDRFRNEIAWKILPAEVMNKGKFRYSLPFSSRASTCPARFVGYRRAIPRSSSCIPSRSLRSARTPI
jgi:adenine-specific DNA-methyltransferase